MRLSPPIALAVLGALASGAAGCAGRGGAPLPFRGPVASSVSVQPEPAPMPTPIVERTAAPPPRRTEPARHLTPSRSSSPLPAASGYRSVRTVVAQAPSPAVRGTALALIGKLRALVGERDKHSSHLQFVVSTLRKLGARLPAIRTTKQLVARATRRHALMSTRHPRLGDIVVFDKFKHKRPLSMTGIVVSVDRRGTVEFVYLARKVVRRGFLNLGRRNKKRDADGKVLNIILRHLQSGDRRSTRYLSGQLFHDYISLRRLSR